MSESIFAAIDLYGTAVRYAVIDQDTDPPHLLQVGVCDLPFDVVDALLTEKTAAAIPRIAEPLAERLAGISAYEVRVLVHPPHVWSFFLPISAELSVRDRKRQLLKQAALLTGTTETHRLSLTSSTVRTTTDSEGDAVMWVHVLAVRRAIEARLSQLVNALDIPRYTWQLSTAAAARAAATQELREVTHEQALRPYALSVGQFPGHTEYALARDRQWYFSHHATNAASPNDRAYFAVALLNRLEIPLDAIGRLFIYGLDVDPYAYAPLQTILDIEPEIMDPAWAVQIPDDLHLPSATPGPFVASIGGALQ
ncbi:hypothetical protein [Salisaeta longa]|uniref:hypothetical protein n=1 Tax=Salisaeta longa TaxID=503170 RepID=UPI0003B438CF|nr:hypothetical protein [Salisaeta longa]